MTEPIQTYNRSDPFELWWHEEAPQELRDTWERISGELLARAAWDQATAVSRTDNERLRDALKTVYAVLFDMGDEADEPLSPGIELGVLGVIRHALGEEAPVG